MKLKPTLGDTRFALVYLVLVVAFGCQNGPGTVSQDAPGEEVDDGIFAVYEGVLPCPDCQGLKSELTLRSDSPIYELRETHMGTPEGDRITDSSGEWHARRGYKKDRGAKVYQLTDHLSKEIRYFLVANDSELRKIDQNLNPIEPARDYTLRRVDQPSPPE